MIGKEGNKYKIQFESLVFLESPCQTKPWEIKRELMLRKITNIKLNPFKIKQLD